ncbi:hypothetical protein MKX03_004374 [Papaver bracteatum]|nr:hypothetical protein MKX03_004374 [Papaver bracteatum]
MDLRLLYILRRIFLIMLCGLFRQILDKYKVYNLCSERLYDASLFEGKVACFDDHICPPIQLITSFCLSAENVVVVHCKAGMARTGLMISSLLLYLKRYVKYFEGIVTYFHGQNQPGRRCMLRGFRLHRCPYWIRPSITVYDHNGLLFSTKKHPRINGLMPEDFWFSAPRKGVVVFALPGELGLTELAGDFKIEFHNRQGDFYCWLNTTMKENRKRKLPSLGFLLKVVLVNWDDSIQTIPTTADDTNKGMGGSAASIPTNTEESGHANRQAQVASKEAAATGITADSKPGSFFKEVASMSHIQIPQNSLF